MGPSFGPLGSLRQRETPILFHAMTEDPVFALTRQECLTGPAKEVRPLLLVRLHPSFRCDEDGIRIRGNPVIPQNAVDRCRQQMTPLQFHSVPET
jgi:hypothetical protein